MAKLDAAKSGKFRIGGEIAVNRLGFGAMRITGQAASGARPPTGRRRCARCSACLSWASISSTPPTATGPDVSEELIREALHPYEDLIVATKAGFHAHRPRTSGRWTAGPSICSRQRRSKPRNLGVEQIDLWQLHRIDPKVPRDGAVRRDQAAARRGHHPLCRPERGVGRGDRGGRPRCSRSRPCRTATISSTAAARTCSSIARQHGIGFIPWFPLAAGDLAKPTGSPLDARQGAWRHPGPDRARLAAEAQPGHAADPRHLEGRAPGGERRGGEHQAHRDEFAARSRGPRRVPSSVRARHFST